MPLIPWPKVSQLPPEIAKGQHLTAFRRRIRLIQDALHIQVGQPKVLLSSQQSPKLWPASLPDRTTSTRIDSSRATRRSMSPNSLKSFPVIKFTSPELMVAVQMPSSTSSQILKRSWAPRKKPSRGSSHTSRRTSAPWRQNRRLLLGLKGHLLPGLPPA